MQIKQKYISRKSGIEENKLSRILTDEQPVSEADMEILSMVAGKDIQFFLQPDFSLKKNHSSLYTEIAFYAGKPTEIQNEVANNLLALIEKFDVVLSAYSSFLKITD